MDKHAYRIGLFGETLSILQQGEYQAPSGKTIALPPLEAVTEDAVMYNEEFYPLLPNEPGRTNASATAKNFVNDLYAVDYPTNSHPNKKAHEFESYMIEEWLKRI